MRREYRERFPGHRFQRKPVVSDVGIPNHFTADIYQYIFFNEKFEHDFSEIFSQVSDLQQVKRQVIIGTIMTQLIDAPMCFTGNGVVALIKSFNG